MTTTHENLGESNSNNPNRFEDFRDVNDELRNSSDGDTSGYIPQTEVGKFFDRVIKWGREFSQGKDFGTKISAGIGGTALVGASIFGVSNFVDNIRGNDTVAAVAPVHPGYSADTLEGNSYIPGDYDGDDKIDGEYFKTLSPEEFAKLDDSIRVAAVGQELLDRMPGAYQDMLQYCTEEEKAILYMPNMDMPREQWTEQDYLNYHTIALYAASRENHTKEELDHARRMATIIFEPGSDNLEYMSEQMGIAFGIKAIYKAEPSAFSGFELYQHTNLDGNYTTGEGGRVAYSDYIEHDNQRPSDVRLYRAFVNRSDDKGNVFPILAGAFKNGSNQLAIIPLPN